MGDRSRTESPVMTRADTTADVLAAKRRDGLSWPEIAEPANADRVWLTSALLGQHPVPPGPGPQARRHPGHVRRRGDGLQEIPTRGSFEALSPTDPTIYRLCKVLQVYGPALKALIHEDFGDGIMSAINFNLALELHGRFAREERCSVQASVPGGAHRSACWPARSVARRMSANRR
jgi:cyanate lyase